MAQEGTLIRSVPAHHQGPRPLASVPTEAGLGDRTFQGTRVRVWAQGLHPPLFSSLRRNLGRGSGVLSQSPPPHPPPGPAADSPSPLWLEEAVEGLRVLGEWGEEKIPR